MITMRAQHVPHGTRPRLGFSIAIPMPRNTPGARDVWYDGTAPLIVTGPEAPVVVRRNRVDARDTNMLQKRFQVFELRIAIEDPNVGTLAPR